MELINGFEISHRDKIYRPKKYYINNYKEFNEWLECFKNFDRSDPFQFYDLREKIGTGGFSVVYRAHDIKTKEEFAMKIIQKYKLTENQKEVYLLYL